MDVMPASDSGGLAWWRGMGHTCMNTAAETVARAHALSGDASFQLVARDVVQIVWALSPSIGENMY